jgi:type II secretory pathway pseudopilin PulG
MVSFLHTKKRGRKMAGGYSLVEMVVYMALFITLSTVLVGALAGLSRAYTEVRVNDDLLDAVHVATERMVREFRNAESIDGGSSVLDMTPGTLVLNALDGSGSPKTVTFALSGGVLQIADSTDTEPRDLTGGRIAVTSLVFRTITTTAGSAVRVEMTVRSLRSPSGRTVSVSETAALRGSYAHP